MRMLTEQQRELLTDLLRWKGAATSAELGGYSPLGNRARQKSKREGLVTFDGDNHHGYWRITDAGQAAMRHSQS